MAKVVIELTNRCNLACDHCFSGRHGGADDLPLEILEKILREAPRLGFHTVGFTGGDPTVYRHFGDAIRLTAAAGLRFGMVTNGWSFPRVYPTVLAHRQALDVVIFSLDGATAATHDGLRGRGSYLRVLRAVSVCVAEGLPFSFNMVVMAHNRHEIAALADLGAALGAIAVRLNHLMPSPITTIQGADLSPAERRHVEAEVSQIHQRSTIPVLMAAGYFTEDLFPCAPLRMEEINVDVYGNLTKCCNLSGHGEGAGRDDVVGSLAEMSFADAYQRLEADNERFRVAKTAHFASGDVPDTDYFPCWYCSLAFDKVGWLGEVPGNPWAPLVLRSTEQQHELAPPKTAGTTA